MDRGMLTSLGSGGTLQNLLRRIFGQSSTGTGTGAGGVVNDQLMGNLSRILANSLSTGRVRMPYSSLAQRQYQRHCLMTSSIPYAVADHQRVPHPDWQQQDGMKHLPAALCGFTHCALHATAIWSSGRHGNGRGPATVPAGRRNGHGPATVSSWWYGHGPAAVPAPLLTRATRFVSLHPRESKREGENTFPFWHFFAPPPHANSPQN